MREGSERALLFVGRNMGRDEADPPKLELLLRCTGQCDVSAMDRIKCATEQSNVHWLGRGDPQQYLDKTASIRLFRRHLQVSCSGTNHDLFGGC